MNLDLLLNTLFRLGLAAAVGGAVGIERELHGRFAGMRTHMLVAMGAAIFAMAGLGLDNGASAEVSRVVQGIATGIGFLGAGTILKLSGDVEVKGLTTAASIWLAAALGMAVGLEMDELAVAGLIAALLVLSALRPIDKWLTRRERGHKK